MNRLPVKRLPVLALLTVLLAGCTSPAAKPGPVSAIVATTSVGRVDQLTVSSPAIGRRATVWVMKPKGWTQGSRDWPVLYLLHPCCGEPDGWLTGGNAEKLTAGLKAVVIMPEASPMGWYTDWVQGPAWERFHLTELRALLEPRYGLGTYRVIAGSSMGGLGAMLYAARNPGMFQAAASLSGVLDTQLDQPGQARFINDNGGDTRRMWGEDWTAHNPRALAAKLRNVRLFVSAGNDKPGPFDQGKAGNGSELSILRQSESFATAATRAGARVTTDFYGPGTHTWEYWSRGLSRAMPTLFPGTWTGRPGQPVK
ncbi:MAG: alpha/beta hydrolase family protein [Streptosporangiaceae bacterium]